MIFQGLSHNNRCYLFSISTLFLQIIIFVTNLINCQLVKLIKERIYTLLGRRTLGAWHIRWHSRWHTSYKCLGGRPWMNWDKNPPVNASPAPFVSTSSSSFSCGTGYSRTLGSFVVATRTGWLPCVMITVRFPAFFGSFAIALATSFMSVVCKIFS